MISELEKGKSKRLSYKPEITAAMIPYIRQSRGLNQKQFSEAAGINFVILSKIESGKVAISDLHLKRIRKAIYKYRISGEELDCIKRMIEIRKYRGY